MIKVREKEVENAKKQITLNDITIHKLKERLQTLEQEQRKGGNGTATVDWETRYREQIDL
jgi:hypothetical protein